MLGSNVGMPWHSCTVSCESNTAAMLLKYCKTERTSEVQMKTAEKVVVGLLWLDRSATGATTDTSSLEYGNKHGNWRNAMSE